MGPPPTIPEPLWTFLYGRRRHRRHGVDCAAVLHGPSGPLEGRVVDISSGGMLLCVPRSGLQLRQAERPGGLVDRNFGRWFLTDLPDQGLELEASLARLAWEPGDDEHVYAGCRFPRTLADASLRSLGIEPEAGTGESPGRAPSTCLPLRAGDGRPFTVEVHAAGDDMLVPLFGGPLVGAGENTLAAHVPDGQLDEIATQIDDVNLVIHVLKGLEGMWTVRARPLAVRPLAADERGVEVVLLADSSPAKLLTSRLAPRESLDAPV